MSLIFLFGVIIGWLLGWYGVMFAIVAHIVMFLFETWLIHKAGKGR